LCKKFFYTISHFKCRPKGSASFDVIWQLLLSPLCGRQSATYGDLYTFAHLKRRLVGGL